MMNIKVFHKRLNSKKCLKENLDLEETEFLVSRKYFPDLYKFKYNKNEHSYIKTVISFIHKNTKYILDNEKDNLFQIQGFFNLLFKLEKEYIKERELHLYIFLFWEKLIWDEKTIKSFNRSSFFYEGQLISDQDKFQINLLPHISKNCDLIYHNKNNYTIELIEIKNVDLEDRAISQIQRYYRKTNSSCEMIEHNLKILNIKPTLIIKHSNFVYKKDKTPVVQYWLTFPTYFREILDIYSFKFCDKNETLKLTNLKPKLKSLIKEQIN